MQSSSSVQGRLSALLSNRWFPCASAVLAVLIFAAAVLILHRQQHNYFNIERSSLAAASSNVYAGAPFGEVYTGILARFLESKPMNESLAAVQRGEVPRGQLQGSTTDGNGIGYTMVSSIGMRLFGPNLLSGVLMLLLMLAASAAAFLWRFGERYSLAVVLAFTVLTVMLFSRLVWDPEQAIQIPVGGIRYFSLLALLPACHLVLEFAETQESDPRFSWNYAWPLAIQTVVLVVAVLVRNSAVPLIAAVVAACFIAAWWFRNRPGVAPRVLIKGACVLLVILAFAAALTASLSKNYLNTGRSTEVIWHRVFISFGNNPAWPFGNLRERYDCQPYIPEGLVSGHSDRNGHCIIWNYAIKKKLPPEAVGPMVYGPEYDAAMRAAFFDVLWQYPWESFKTFAYYKVGRVFESIWQSLAIAPWKYGGILIVLLLAALSNFYLSARAFDGSDRSHKLMLLGGITLLFGGFSISSYLIAWAFPNTTADLLFCCLFGLGLFVSSVIAGRSRPAASPNPA